MREKILDILKKEDKAKSLEELDNLLGLTTADEYKELVITINELCDEYIVYHSNKNRYMLMDKGPLKKGIFRANKKGYGFVEIENQDEDVYISLDNVNGAIHNDHVLVEELHKKQDGRIEGRILRIIKRSIQSVVGEIKFKKQIGFVTPDDNKLHFKVVIPKGKTMGAVDGHKVLASIIGQAKGNNYRGEIIKILGHKNDPGVDILSIVYKYDIEDTFPDEVKEELRDIPMEVDNASKRGRRDLTDECIFTIDGDDTKDIDDAISIEKLDNGNYKLGVHIADVSYYVKEGTALDNDAMNRGTSVYLVDRVIPMLPHQLSNGICSLNPGVERLAISCVMEIDNSGNIKDYEIFESVIKSRIQMTYKKVNSILEDNIVPEGYDAYVDKLQQMSELAKILRKSKLARGYLDFDVDEAKIIVDDNCHPIDIVLRNRGVGENLIEDFMIVANECVATHIFYMELPFIYRVHEYPKEEKIHDYLTFLGSLGYVYHGNMKDTNPKSIQKLLDFLQDKKEFKILSSLLLRNMQKAVYRPENLGHYGLASKCYTHFTSPIRRYPDTTVHRLLRTYLFNGDISSETIRHWQEKLVFISENSSARERASVNCEREVEDMKMAEYMEDYIGEKFEGMISSVTNFGLFVELDNLVEGLCRLSDMDDFYHYDEATMTVIGERTNKRYTIGDRVVIKVKSASKEEQTIDFEILGKVVDVNERDSKNIV